MKEEHTKLKNRKTVQLEIGKDMNELFTEEGM